MVSTELQESFNLAFPEHAGHMVKEVSDIFDLSYGFICSCCEKIRITLAQSFAWDRDGDSRKTIYDYIKDLQEKRGLKFRYLWQEAGELGYCLVPATLLAELTANMALNKENV